MERFDVRGGVPFPVPDRNCPPPDLLDAVSFEYRGVSFKGYGVLHGITGGMNAAYGDMLVRTVNGTGGLLFAEKSLLSLLPGSRPTISLCDWAVLSAWDTLGLGLRLTLLPSSWRVMLLDAPLERLRKGDPFLKTGRAEDLGGSPYFHIFDPWERRRLIGYPDPGDGFRHDLTLLARPWKELLPRMPRTLSPVWNRILRLVQRHGHFPVRSLHMLHYAATYAERTGQRQVSVFVGETHNTDMAWLAEHEDEFREALPQYLRRPFDRTVSRAEKLAAAVLGKKPAVEMRWALYLAGQFVGAAIGAGILLATVLGVVIGWIYVTSKRF